MFGRFTKSVNSSAIRYCLFRSVLTQAVCGDSLCLEALPQGRKSNTEYKAQAFTRTAWPGVAAFRLPETSPAKIKTQSACTRAQSCLTICKPTDCSPPGSSVHGIFQARVGCHFLLLVLI